MAQIVGTRIASRLASKRIVGTDAPCIVGMQKIMESIKSEDMVSLAQGIVYWKPPEKALKKAQENGGFWPTETGAHLRGRWLRGGLV